MSESNNPTPSDFDAWARLASTDPTAFEHQRSQVINRAIRRAPTPVSYTHLTLPTTPY